MQTGLRRLLNEASSRPSPCGEGHLSTALAYLKSSTGIEEPDELQS